MKNFQTDEARSTPYQRARQVIDDRIGGARVQARNWRLAALMALICTLVAVLGLIYQSSKASVIPYVVEIDGQGSVRLVGAANVQTWQPTEGIKRHFLEEWLLDIREVSSDKEVIRQKLLSAYEAVSGTAKAQLDSMIEATKPFEQLGKETRQLEISSINSVSDDSYRVEWIEKTFNKSGYIDRSEKYVGIVSLTHQQPKNRAEMERNPLGIYVTHFSINQRSSDGNTRNVKGNKKGDSQ